MNSDYKKNEMTYNKDFIQKTFVTSGLGVNLIMYNNLYYLDLLH